MNLRVRQTTNSESRAVANKSSSNGVAQLSKNNTGLPDNLKSGIENLSGYSMDDVKVHYNSSQPAQLNAHAYAQGNQIHLAPGQEKHLPHEAWHVVQQKQGRVRPTIQLRSSVPVNDDQGLEQEADVMGQKAIQKKSSHSLSIPKKQKSQVHPSIVQRSANQVTSHIYEANMSPLLSVTLFISANTGYSYSDVLKDYKESAFPKAYRDAMISPTANFKPISVKALIYDVSGSSGRKTPKIQTGIGKLGNFENLIRGRGTSQYDGGHLLGYGWYKDWPLINSATNIAPQKTAENRAIFGFHGAWGGEEIEEREIAGLLPLRVTASVNYASTTYTASLHWLAEALLRSGSDVKKTIDSMYTKRLRYTTINTRIPSQYALHYSPVNVSKLIMGSDDLKNADNTNADGRLPDSVAIRSLFGPAMDFWMRYGDQWSKKGRQYRSRYGGGIVSQNTNFLEEKLIANIASELVQGMLGVGMMLYRKQLASNTLIHGLFSVVKNKQMIMAVSRMIAAAGLPASMVSAIPWALIAHNYFGQGSAVSVIQQMSRRLLSDRMSIPVDAVLNFVEGNALKSFTTPDGIISTSKSLIVAAANVPFLVGDVFWYGYDFYNRKKKKD